MHTVVDEIHEPQLLAIIPGVIARMQRTYPGISVQVNPQDVFITMNGPVGPLQRQASQIGGIYGKHRSIGITIVRRADGYKNTLWRRAIRTRPRQGHTDLLG